MKLTAVAFAICVGFPEGPPPALSVDTWIEVFSPAWLQKQKWAASSAELALRYLPEGKA